MEFVSKRVQHVSKLSQEPPRFCATDLQNLEQTKKKEPNIRGTIK